MGDSGRLMIQGDCEVHGMRSLSSLAKAADTA
jgi:hypothetical protein